jgi:hypothetical protein
MVRSIKMELWEKIIAAYPEINTTDNFRELGIHLRDDSDGQGAYIAKWEYSQPLPEGMKVGK